MSTANYISRIIINRLPKCNISKNDRREIGLQINNFEERKKIQIRKQIRKQNYNNSVETGVWNG
jgi:hypothetical protein